MTEKSTGTLMLDIKEINVGENARKKFEKKSMDELTASVKVRGVLSPLLVRSANGHGLVLIAGHRRLKAATEAGLKQVPVRILDVTEYEAREIQAVENLQRADLSPMEEARALSVLLRVDGSDYQAVASRVGKPVSYVVRAIRLLELPEKMQEAIDEGKVSPAHGHQILRVAPKYREGLVKFALSPYRYGNGLPTLDDLKGQVESRIERSLTQAPFPVDGDFKGLPPCGDCAFNSKTQGDLFDGAKGGNCTNPECYGKKAKLHRDAIFAAAQSKWHMLSYFGEGRPDWAGNVKGHPIIDPKKMAKQIIKTPEKFGLVLVTGEGKAPKAAIVCIDPKSVPGAPKSNNSADHVRETPEQRELREKESFVSEKIADAFLLAALPKLETKALSVDNLRSVIEYVIDNGYFPLAQPVIDRYVQSCGATGLKGLKADELNAILSLLVFFGEGISPKQLAALKVDAKAVEKRARDEAVREWDERTTKKEKSA